MVSSWPIQLERELLQDAGRRSFRAFVKHIVGITRSPLGYWWTEDVHGPWCDWLQGEVEAWERAKERWYLLIDAHRGSAKTMIVTKILPIWLSLRNPNLAVVIDAIEQTQAIEFTSFAKNVFDDDDPYSWFVTLYGSWEGSKVWTQERFTHSARRVNRTDPSFRAGSVEKGITGAHPDVLILDDPVTMEKLREQGNWLTIAKRHMDSIYPALLNHSLFILVGTPYTDNDVITSTIRAKGIQLVVGEPLPKDYQRYHRQGGQWRMYHLPALKSSGESMIPKAWPMKKLEEYRADKPADFASQMMLCPGSGDTVALTFAQIEECIVTPGEVPRGLPITLHFDTAFKSPKKMGTGDFSTILVAAHHRSLSDVYYLAEHGANNWRDDDFIERLMEIVRYYREKNIPILAMTDERQIGGKEGLWEHRLRSAFRDAGQRMPRFIQINRGKGENNTARIAEAAGYWIEGHVKLVRGKCPNLVEQMARIGISEHDDYASAAADAFNPQIYQVFQASTGRESPVPRGSMQEILSGSNPSAAYDAWNRVVGPRTRPPIR